MSETPFPNLLSFYPCSQPRPQGAFPWLSAPKAREKRPGDEVALLPESVRVFGSSGVRWRQNQIIWYR